MKSLSSRKTAFLGIAVIALILLGWGYTSGFFFERGLTPCAPPPGMMVDGVARASVYTWLDENGNGISDPGENPLSGVEIIYPALSKPTNDQGQAETSQFKPGCACNCWEHEYVEVRAPKGYQATTPLRLELTGETGLYSFGFERVEPNVSILPEQTATPVRPTPSPTAVPATKTQASTTTVEMTMESGYPAPPTSPTPLSPAEPWKDCARTPSLIGCDTSAPQLAGHVAFYDLEGGQLVGIDLKTGEGWAVAMSMPESLKWSPDGSQLLVEIRYDLETRTADDILLANDGKILNVFTGKKWMYWHPQGASLRNYDEVSIVRSTDGAEAFLGYSDYRRSIHYRLNANAEWQIEDLDVVAHELPLEIYGWLPGTQNVIFTQLSGISTYSSIFHGENIFLYNTQTKELLFHPNFHGHLKPQFADIQGSKLAIIELYGGLVNNTLAVLDGITGERDRPLLRQYNTEIQSYSLWQMAWQPRNGETEGLFALMVRMVETNWTGVIPSEMFPTGGIYLYNRAENQAQMIREIPKDMLGGNFHFTADGRYLLYSVTPMDMPDGAETLMYVREMRTGKEWVLFDRLHNPRTGIGGIYWNLIAVSIE